MVRAARSLMFVPGHRRSMIDKALALTELDVVLLDLEDGVPPGEIATARTEVAAALGRSGERRVFVRTHRVGPELYADLAAAHGAEAVVLPKVESADEVTAAEGASVIASIETARGLLAAPQIARAPHVVGLMFGGEDFARDLGLPVVRTAEAQDLLFARSAVVVAATAVRVPAFDSVWTDIRDLDGLRGQSLQARRLGFTGKTLIHPSHVAIVNEAFTPSADEIAQAHRVIDAFAASHGAAIAIDGEMVDAPVVERARRVLELARD